MLAQRYSKADLAAMLVPREHYRPYPTASDRAAWLALPDDLKESQISIGERYLNTEWPPLPATRFMEFARTGNRSNFEQLSFARRTALAALVVAECIEAQGRFIDDIINGVWAICEETWWGVPAHNYVGGGPREPLPDVTRPSIDLFAAETGSLLALTHYLLAPQLDTVSPLIARRIRQACKERIMDPYLDRDDFWWMGLEANRPMNNWNPWCNSNCLITALLMEENPQRRLAAVDKALRSLDRFIDPHPADGGCDEGPSYWSRAGGSLFDCLETLYSATQGGIDVYGEPLIADIGRYLYRAHISGDYYINFADASARVQIPADLVFRYGRRIGDDHLAALGASAHHARRDRMLRMQQPLPRHLPALFNFTEIDRARATPPYIPSCWLPDIQVMATREQAGSASGFFLAAKGGHNGESHNHNDVGQFIVFYDGQPVLIDVGVETYTAKTFGSQRYDIWTMQSAYHNLPTVNGVQQMPGRHFAARAVRFWSEDETTTGVDAGEGAARTEAAREGAAREGAAREGAADSAAAGESGAPHATGLTLDIAGAYPPEAGIQSWQRTVRLTRAATPAVELLDVFTLNGPTADLQLSLMTPCKPELTPGKIRLLVQATTVTIAFDGQRLAASWEEIAITDSRLKPIWGDRLYRIRLRAQAPVTADTWHLVIAANKARQPVAKET